MTKIIKRVKDCSYGKRLEKLELTTLIERRMRVNLIEIFKIIIGMPAYGGHFSLFLVDMKFYNQDRFQKLSLLAN